MATARVVYKASADTKRAMAQIVVDMAADETFFELEPGQTIEYKLERRGAYRPAYQASVYVDGKFMDAAGMYRCSCGEVVELFFGQVPMCWHCCQEFENEDLFD